MVRTTVNQTGRRLVRAPVWAIPRGAGQLPCLSGHPECCAAHVAEPRSIQILSTASFADDHRL